MAMVRRPSSPSSVVRRPFTLEKRTLMMILTARFNSIPLMCVIVSAFFLRPWKLMKYLKTPLRAVCTALNSIQYYQIVLKIPSRVAGSYLVLSGLFSHQRISHRGSRNDITNLIILGMVWTPFLPSLDPPMVCIIIK